MIAGQYRPAANAFKRRDDGGRLDRGATEEAGICGVADIVPSPAQDFLRLELGHIGIGIDAKIGSASYLDAVGFEPGHLARMNFVDIRRQQ